MAAMDTLISVAGPALAILIALSIVSAIRALAGRDDPSTDLATFLAPVAGAVLRDPSTPRPVVREGEPVRWNFGPIDTTPTAA